MTEEAAAGTPPDEGLPPKRSLLRRVFRPSIVVGLLAAIVIAGNVWMYLIVDGWRAEDAELREAARISADSVGASNAIIASQTEMIALLQDQTDAAAAWSADLEPQIDAAKDVSNGYKNAALGFERCGDKRAQAIAALWSGKSATALASAADAECAAAQALLNAASEGS